MRRLTASSAVLSILLAVLFLLAAGPAHAHPVPRRNHDRMIVVRMVPGKEGALLKVQVHYRLEVDEFTGKVTMIPGEKVDEIVKRIKKKKKQKKAAENSSKNRKKKRRKPE